MQPSTKLYNTYLPIALHNLKSDCDLRLFKLKLAVGTPVTRALGNIHQTNLHRHTNLIWCKVL